MKKLIAAFAVLCIAGSANAQSMEITEWMYSGNGGEFIEFTNMSFANIDLSSWSYDDDSRLAGTVVLSQIGIVKPGESVILTEDDPSVFRAAWGLAPTVQVHGFNTTNIGNGDEINLYNGALSLIDRLTYGSNPRTQRKSATIPLADLPLTTSQPSWALAADGDIYGSWTSANGDIGNPGKYYAAVPEPGSLLALASGLVGFGGMIIRRRK